MESIAQKLIKLRLSTRKACRKKDGKASKSVLSLSDKALFLLMDRPLPPDELTDALCISHANLTHLTDKMIRDGLLEKSRVHGDGRCVCFQLTQRGLDEIRDTLSYLDDKFRMILTTESEYNKASDNIDEVLQLLSFL